MTEQTVDNVLSEFMGCLSESWAETLQRLRGVAHTTAINDDTIPEPGATPVWLTVAFDGLLVGDTVLMVSADDVHALRGSPEQPSASPAEESEIQRGPVEDGLRQSVIVALKAFQERHGRLVGRIEFSQAPAWATDRTFVLTSTCETLPPLRLAVLCSPDLRINTSNSTAGQAPQPDSGEPENLDLVLNAALEISLRFGQQNLTLGTVSQLGTGSVVELDRKVEEPVELILDGRVFARGEVMIVDGNYGLRVTEVCNGGLS